MPFVELQPERSLAGDPVIWRQICVDAQAASSDQALARFLWANVLVHDSVEAAVTYRAADRLADPSLPAEIIRDAFSAALADQPDLSDAILRDVQAFYSRDPGCARQLHALLYYKGFLALAVHRLGHWLWGKGRTDFALLLQGRVAAEFQVDIHPAVQIGSGIYMDHATGVVASGAVEICDDVVVLHRVTLAGPPPSAEGDVLRIGPGVSIGADVVMSGAITIGDHAKIGTGAFVDKDVPAGATAVGDPLRILQRDGAGQRLWG